MLIKKLFTLKNTLILILVLLAFAGAIFPDVLQKLGFSPEQVVLALLAGLAIDTLIERMGYLERIETSIASLERKIEPQVSIDHLYRPRAEMRSFLPWLRGCEQMWVAGKDLNELLSSFGGQIQQAAMVGKRFRFLIIDPDDSALVDKLAAGSYLRPDSPSREAVVRQVVAIFRRMMRDTPKGSVEVRLMNWIPTNSYVMVDAHKEYGQMSVEMFGYKITSGERPHIILTRSKDSQAFAFHLSQFENMWENAKPLPDDHL